MDVITITDAPFGGNYQLEQAGGVCAPGMCTVSVTVLANTTRGYAMDVNGTAMLGTDLATIACSFATAVNTAPQVLGTMTGSCNTTASATTMWNATASFALVTAIDGGTCTTPELSITITAMDNSTHSDLRFGQCP